MRIDIAAQTDVGKRKKTNEDFYGVFRENTAGLQLFEEGSLLCVADGLGGHIGGEIASKLAVSVIKDMLKEQPPPAVEPSAEEPEKDDGYFPVLRKWMAAANLSIYRTNQDLVKARRPMGTTLLVALVLPRKVYIANVGDSRCYHIRDGEIIDKTEDHSWVDEQVKLGLMSRSEAESDARRNLVTRSIGTHPEVPVDEYLWHIVPGDWLLLCTDGLVNMVKDSEIRPVFLRGGAADIAHRLVGMANEAGGKDNITVLVANVNPSAIRHLKTRARAFFGGRGKWVLRLIWMILFGALCFAAGYVVRGLIAVHR